MSDTCKLELTTVLQSQGLKVTEARLQILNILRSNTVKHLSAEDIFTQLSKQGKSVGIATVYRTLGQLEAVGLIDRHSFSDHGAVYELCTNDHHDHMVCNQCGKVIEFVNQAIEKLQQQVAEQAGFNMLHHSLILYGVCKKCQT